MELSKKSLLAKAIIYNDIAILLTSLIVFVAMSFVIFKDIDSRVPNLLKDASKNLEISYTNYIDNIESFVKDTINNGNFDFQLKQLDDLREIEKKYRKFSSDDKKTPVSISKFSTELLNYMAQQLQGNDYFNNVYFGLSLADYNGKIIAEKLDWGKLEGSRYSLNNDIQKFRMYMGANKENEVERYFETTKDTNEILIRMIIKLDKGYKNIRYVVLTTLVDNKFLNTVKTYVDLNENIKLFILYEDKYIDGELEGYTSGTQFFKNKNRELYAKNNVENGKKYSFDYVSIKDSQDRVVGDFGLALSKYVLIEPNMLYYLVAFAIILLLILIFSMVFGKLYSNLFMPLIALTDISNKVASGNLDVKWRIKAEGEIKSLSESMKKMVMTIKHNQEDLELQNEKLKDSILRINMIEKLLMNIHSEDDIDQIIFYILGALTSKVGLDYGRAIYLEFDSELDILKGKLSSTNIKLIDNNNELFKFTSGLKLQTESLDKIIRLISIELDDNYIAKSFKEQKIIYYNDRGFKYNLGSELLTSLGLNNFILMPVYTENKSYGLIVIDQSISKKYIQEEDIELLNLLSMNITIYLKNKELEKEKLTSEKHSTITYLSNKILREIQLPMVNIKDIIEEYNQNEVIDKEKIYGIDKNINKITKLSSMVLDYSDSNKYAFEKIDLKDVIDKSIENCRWMLKETVIDLSKLYTHREDVIGNKNKLIKVITNVIQNAVEAVDNVGGRINITTKSLPNAVQIKISDNGEGIEEKNLKKIFDPFVSLRDSSGLGLAIAKKIVKEHGGEIRVRSAINKGTEVRIILNIFKEE